MVIEFIFFAILCGSAFTLRGIWGHHIGGAVMGVLVGLGTSLVFKIPLNLTLALCFYLSITWALCSIVGWARHKALGRFIRGYFFYGLIPNLIMGFILFRSNYTIIFQLAFIGGMGMGLGFGLSYPLIEKIRAIYLKNHKEKYPDGPHLTFIEINHEEDANQISFIHLYKFDSWKILLEIFSGFLYGITTLLILFINRDHIPIFIIMIVQDVPLSSYIYASFIFIVIPSLCLMDCILYKSKINGLFPLQDQKPWTEKKRNFHLKIVLFCALVLEVLSILLIEKIPIILFFLLFYWTINIFGRLRHHLDTPLFKADMYLDFGIGIFISILLFLI